ncbi:5'-nucleotidase C-terminal domain-containing protein [Yimella sp. cx-573]|nr:5'-nucleotidase C-terminal domain-containing protein [Yimella sp. cx-573]
MQPTRLLGVAATAALVASVASTPSALAATNVGDGQIASGLTKISLLNTNDFHGHFTKDFACTVTSAQNELGATFLSAGDNIGGTPFASAVQNDEPAIDYLNALGLKASAVGNHEFDKGFDDLTGRVQTRAAWTYLGANVYRKGTTTPALPEYKMLDINGLKVAVVGAVTKDVPSLVAAGGIATLDFGDPVAAVNRVTTKLKDGDAANGEADVVVAEYHEGAPSGDGSSLAAQTAANTTFNAIVNQTSAGVDAIFTGHTHQIYAWDGPVPGGTGTRPVVQTDFYASHVGVLQLGYDPTTKKVTQYSLTNREVTAPTAACEADPAYQSAARIVDTANARADVIGKQPIGKLTADVTTAVKPDGTRDDRTRESTLSNLIAQSYVDSINKPGRPGGVDIGVMNPGGVRAELKYGTDGTITYADAASIMPFNNTITTIDLTGAQLKKVLEQQWQPEGSSRPFLKLGLSKNVTYTYDPDAAAGSRITSVTVNGAALDPAKKYTVASNSFLTAGGDNFTAFSEGTGRRDSGLIDQSLFIEWIKEHSPISPSFAKNGVAVQDQPSVLTQGKEATFTVSGIDFTSAGSPTTTSLEVFLGSTSLGTFPVEKVLTSTPPFPSRNETATISIKVPATAMTGAQTLTLKAAQTGTTVTMPVTVMAGAEPTTPTSEPTSPTTEPSTSQPSTTEPGSTDTGSSTVTGPPVVTDGPAAGSNSGVLAAGAGSLAVLLAGAWVLGRRLN